MAIEVYNTTFEYIPGTPVFYDISFSLGEGTILSILGPNGCGKTTFLKCILGILKPSSGTMVTPKKNAIGYVPQEHGVSFPYTVQEMVVMGRAREIGFFSVPDKNDEDIAQQCLKTLSITHLAEKRYNEISGGEKQLVLIARALASGSTTLVLDEPASSLDFKNQQLVLEVLRNLSKTRRYAIIMTTHHPQHALFVSDMVLLMSSDASLPICGNTADVLTEENLKRIYGVDARIITIPGEQKTVKGVIPIPRMEI